MTERSRQSIISFLLVLVWLVGCTSSTQFSTPTTTIIPATVMPAPTATPTRIAQSMQVLNQELIRAAETGNTLAVQQLLASGANINARDDMGRTPVMAATQGNRVQAVRMLIQAGADVNMQDNRKDNPFLYAGAEGLLEILKLTIDAKADTKITNRFGGTALIPASERGHVEVVRELLTRTDVNVNHVNNLGWTALLEAVILGNGGERHQQIVQLLIDHEANVNLADKDGVTPLKHAQTRGFRQIATILERVGAR